MIPPDPRMKLHGAILPQRDYSLETETPSEHIKNALQMMAAIEEQCRQERPPKWGLLDFSAVRARLEKALAGIEDALSVDGITPDDAPLHWRGDSEAAAYVEGYEAGQESVCDFLWIPRAAPPAEQDTPQ